ncbi:MAG: (E)-4-hydroxy-3-methylbut-2-enyl-diphosphate synthase [Bacteroidales bacterium]|nr:(E)-4-hydroxy-3-methylbut-2-enyl-diphosphate synthase [Bacteroidales bacterium]
MERLKTIEVRVGDSLVIGGGHDVVVQTMCNTHTSDVPATVAQCLELAAAGAQMIRVTVPGLQDVPALRSIRQRLFDAGCRVPLVADIHFSSDTAIACASVVEKVRINPGNFHPDHEKAREKFAEFLEVCREHGTAVRVGLNHGSLGKYITELFGNTPFAMAKAAMEWLQMCIDASFFNVVVSLKASNTVVMVQAYRELAAMMKQAGVIFPLHLGVTEAGNGESGRIKSCVGIASLLREGIGDTIRVSLTENPVNELPVARYLADYFKPEGPSVRDSVLDAAISWGPRLLDREIDEIPSDAGVDPHLVDEIMQAARRRFYKPEYIACPGCGRTMYKLEETFEEVKRRTSHLKGMVIAVMGCIVNGPGEMADADWGYVGEGGGRVSIYRKGQPVLKHVPDNEAIDRLLELIASAE